MDLSETVKRPPRGNTVTGLSMLSMMTCRTTVSSWNSSPATNCRTATTHHSLLPAITDWACGTTKFLISPKQSPMTWTALWMSPPVLSWGLGLVARAATTTRVTRFRRPITTALRRSLLESSHTSPVRLTALMRKACFVGCALTLVMLIQKSSARRTLPSVHRC